MEARWRWEAMAALYCVLLLPAWAWVTGLKPHAFSEIVLCCLLGFGVGFGLSGTRRGTRVSRWVSAICLVVLLVVAVGYIALVRSDPWLYP